MNRTIASGIFTQPFNVLFFAGSSGVAIILWCFADVIVFCIVACWLKMALSIPIFRDASGMRLATPRSDGDKNYVRYPSF